MKHVGTRNRQWFLKVELMILVCLACFWAFKSGDVDIVGVEAGVRSANTPATKQADFFTGDISLDVVLKMAKGGDADAQCNLGLMYAEGQGVPQNYKEAVKWYTKAIKTYRHADKLDEKLALVKAYLQIGDRESALKQHDILKALDGEMAAEKLPGSSTSPYEVIQSKYNDVKYLLGRQFQQDQRALQSRYLSGREYQEKNVALNSHYSKLLEQQTFEHRAKIQNLDWLKGSVSRGEITEQAAYQAGWKMVLPSETYQARFPTPSKE